MARDDQLIENLRARTWPGDCEAAAFRIEELLARVAELEAERLEREKQEPVAWMEWAENAGAWFLAYSENPDVTTKPLYAAPPVTATARLTDSENHANELRSCNSLHGSDRTGTGMLGCLYRMRVTDPGCTGCVDRDEDQSAEAGG